MKWPPYAAVWRWHFYAGLLCIPFVCWLAVTGSIYLFRSDYEAWYDKPIEQLNYGGSRQSPAAEAAAAIAAVPGSVFSRYEPPATARGAAQIIVQSKGEAYRVAVHPHTLAPLRLERDGSRLMERMFDLHGTLGFGDPGSYVMETAASWTIVMIVTGIFLWFPRTTRRLKGVLVPRLGAEGRTWWRDLHAVSGLWISVIVLAMLISGLPWSSGWGAYLTAVRGLASGTQTAPNWPISKSPATMPGMTAEEMAAMPSQAPAEQKPPSDSAPWALSDLDTVVPVVNAQHLVRPIWISPPAKPGDPWSGASQAQDRTLRREVKLDATGQVVGESSFATLPRLDRVVNIGISMHEGHLFGRANQAMLLTAAVALVGMSVGAIVMWWRRRPNGRLGAPAARAERPVSVGLVVLICVLAALLPLFGASLIVILLVERLVLARIAPVSEWLGLRATPGKQGPAG